MDILTYILSKRYIEDSLKGVSALNGKSAYEIACDNGFKGSQEEWLDSLKGETPRISDDGTWVIGEVDTGILASPDLFGYATEDYVNESVKVVGEALAKKVDKDDAIPVPEIAAVGQTVMVKTVDENGKPTGWEAVDKPAYIANVRVDRGRYSFIDGSYETLLNAYNSGATVGLNANDYIYYLFKVYDDNLHFGQIPYTDNGSEIAEIPNQYLMVAPDNSITQTRRDIATVGFVREAIQSIPVGGGANWNQNDPEAPDYVKNRTHWEEDNQTIIEWDGDRNGHEVITIVEDIAYVVRVSSLTPTIADVIGGTVVLHDNNNPGEYLEEILTEDNVLPGDYGCFMVGSTVIVVTDAPITISGITINSNGVYFMDSLDGTVKSLTYGSTAVHKLDEKFIPDSIARKTDIGQNPSQGGCLTTAQISALDGLLRLVKYESDPTGAYAAFCEAFGITAKTLVGISAVYTGGEVASGTALTELDGITVTATYSDGSTAVVTGYTLSGEIDEGSNTITVTYGGKTATITVVGVAAGEGPVTPLYGRFWPPMNKIYNWSNPQWADVDNYGYTANSGQYIDAGFPAGVCVRLDGLQGAVYIRTLTVEQYGYLPAAYRVFANADGEIASGGFVEVEPVIHRNLATKEVDGRTYHFVLFEFRIPAGQTGYFVSAANAAGQGFFLTDEDGVAILDEYKPYYTLFDFDPSDRITEPATEVA